MRIDEITMAEERHPEQALRLLDRLARGRNNIPPLTHRVTPKEYADKGRVDVEKAGVVDVPLDQIYSYQPGVNVAWLRRLLRSPQDGTPTFFYTGGKYYLHDGNHRVAAAHLLGKRTIRGWVYGREAD